MSGISAQDFLSTYEGNEYPKDFLGAYEPVECLSHNAMGETLLVRDRAGTLYVAKCYTDPNLRPRRSESALLGDFKHEGLPALVAEYEGTGMLAVVREYMPGEPLDRLNVPLGEKEALDICIKVCALLGCLHAQKPPVIHRDVKPQNIVMDGSGSVSLIDFGIARAYDEAASADTVSMGTREFASPEQFGFAQTDPRSDVYSLGVVLLWLLTGSTDTHRAAPPNRRLARVIRKATAFSPEKRYRSANALGRALARADGRVGRAVTRTAAAAAALLCALTGGFALGRYTDLRPAGVFLNQYVTFAEPCVENAVRIQLGKAEDEPIRAEELEQVEQLYLYGDQTAATLDAFYTLRTAADSGAIEVKAGEIA
ncbi:MAG TPA: serine/threonine-protein kinase, partial [Clostridia bacterium]|nr:serine/threonine-protein kinase [Clostridia bacterium]